VKPIFITAFIKRHPGMSLDSLTARDEYDRWIEGYIAGCDETLALMCVGSAKLQELQA
jgi:hypothetical protein